MKGQPASAGLRRCQLAARVALGGDATLDNVVNLSDFNILAANFGLGERSWQTGDFNRDGLTNLADFNILAGNFGLTAAGPTVTPAHWAAIASTVPEPSVVPLFMPALHALSGRLRKRSVASVSRAR